jgi:hypothetical protein
VDAGLKGGGRAVRRGNMPFPRCNV